MRIIDLEFIIIHLFYSLAIVILHIHDEYPCAYVLLSYLRILTFMAIHVYFPLRYINIVFFLNRVTTVRTPGV